jgi:branched-chain amino acid transport system permease protein
MSSIANVEFWALVGVVAGIYTIFGLGLQIQVGFAGILNFGHVASMAVGAYAMAILVVKAGMTLWAASLLAIAIAAAFGALAALPALRLRADYFAITTFALGEIVRYVALNAEGLTGGSQGTVALRGSSGSFTYNTDWLSFQATVQDLLRPLIGDAASPTVATLVVVWVVVVLLIVVLQRLVRAPWGRVLRGIRDDEDATEAIGKHVFAVKVQVLAVGAALGGVAGLLYAFQFGFFGPSDFDPLATLIAYMVVILGGTARNWAVPVGALVFGLIYAATRFLDFPPFDWFGSADRAYLRLIIIGAILIALMMYRPQGVLGRRQELAFD